MCFAIIRLVHFVYFRAIMCSQCIASQVKCTNRMNASLSREIGCLKQCSINDFEGFEGDCMTRHVYIWFRSTWKSPSQAKCTILWNPLRPRYKICPKIYHWNLTEQYLNFSFRFMSFYSSEIRLIDKITKQGVLTFLKGVVNRIWSKLAIYAFLSKYTDSLPW